MEFIKKYYKILIAAAAVIMVCAMCAVLIANLTGAVRVYPVSEISMMYYDDDYFEGQLAESGAEEIVLADSAVESVNVKEGDTVSKGDVLIKYDSTAYKLAIESAQANIALIESQIAMLQSDIQKYSSMTPTEAVRAPVPAARTYSAESDKTVRTAEYRPMSVTDTDNTGSRTDNSSDAGGSEGNSDDVNNNEPAASGDDASDDDEPAASGDDVNDNDVNDNDVNDNDVNDNDEPAVSGDDVNNNDEPAVSGDDVNDNDEPAVSGSEDNEPPYEYEIPDGYTRAELSEIISGKQKELSAQQLKLQSARLQLRKEQLTAETGEVKAETDGIVTSVKDPEKIQPGDTVITIKKDTDSKVMFYADEFRLSELKVNDWMSVRFYDTDSVFSAKITDISDIPAENYYMYSGNSVSYYPVTCSVAGYDDELRSGSGQYSYGNYCEVRPFESGNNTDAVYIESAYVRNDDEGAYVYAADENGRLEKRYVTIKLLNDSYVKCIVDGITLDDYIAFPYGNGVTEGARIQVNEDAAGEYQDIL